MCAIVRTIRMRRRAILNFRLDQAIPDRQTFAWFGTRHCSQRSLARAKIRGRVTVRHFLP